MRAAAHPRSSTPYRRDRRLRHRRRRPAHAATSPPPWRFVAAGGGLKVAKHGNRALSSQAPAPPTCWPRSASTSTPALDQQRQALDEAGICFLFAPAHHGAMRHVSPIRAGAGLPHRLQPAGPADQPGRRPAPGAGRLRPARWVEPLARVLGALGAERAWVVHGAGMDEMTTTGETQRRRVARRRQVRLFTITPEAVGLPRADLADLQRRRRRPRTPRRCATCWTGETGPYRDIVLLNAAAAFLVGEKVETLREGVDLAGRGDRRRPRAGRARPAWSPSPTAA